LNPDPDTYTHGHHDSVLRSHRWRTAANSAAYLLPHLTPGQRVLDVGCGPGTITLDLARAVAPGPVIGIDRAEEPLEAARSEAAALGIGNVTFTVGDVYAIDLADASTDIVHAHQVLQHLTDPVAALMEMRRVCKPDGLVAARDTDYSAMTWYPADERLDRWLALYLQVARSNSAEPDGGRHVKSWALRAGYSDVLPSASAWCYATREACRWWASLWADRIVLSSLAEQALERELATPDELRELAQGWLDWADHEDAWFGLLHGEVLCRP
jgi:ubiquinone/menaquinone biosynthesis C-methylase UbiE